MTVDSQCGDSTPKVNTSNWKSIGELARALAEKAAQNG